MPKNYLVLKLVVFIVDWTNIKKISTILPKENDRFYFVCKGRGTASSEILDLLGIGSIEKAVVICLEEESAAPDMVQTVGDKIGLKNRGAGIAFTVPLSSISHPMLKLFTPKVRDEKSETQHEYKNETEGEKKMPEEIKYDLIVAVLNQGYSDEFMKAAREAGAGGGTVINSRGLSGGGTKKIFGISIQDEKEIIIILSTRAKKTPIMSVVSKSYGVSSKAEGLIFSLPVDSISGVELR
ncbi:MAG: hypothetical protein LBD20_10105 [Spirochaetaceae bacterium]|jgi:hypothetical protein|nr:hypothetical protein [Spirochaetaceae bacterium]